MANSMASNTYAGTVMSHSQNTTREGKKLPGGNMLVDFKVKDQKAMNQPSLCRVRLNDQDTYDYLVANGLGKGAQVAIMANGIHDWDENKDGTLPAKGDKPARPIRRFINLDLSTIHLLKGVTVYDDSVTDDAAANKAVAGLLSNLAKSAAAAFSVPTRELAPAVEVPVA